MELPASFFGLKIPSRFSGHWILAPLSGIQGLCICHFPLSGTHLPQMLALLSLSLHLGLQLNTSSSKRTFSTFLPKIASSSIELWPFQR